jgi:hypothetical protein
MLKMGMMDLLSTLTAEKETLQKDEEIVADLEDKADQAHHTEKSTELKRGTAAGTKTTSEEEYKDEHDAFRQTSSSLLKEIYIIKRIKMKILSYCATGSWDKTRQQVPFSLIRQNTLPLLSPLRLRLSLSVRRGRYVQQAGYLICLEPDV